MKLLEKYNSLINLVLTVLLVLMTAITSLVFGKRDAEYKALCDRVDAIEKNMEEIKASQKEFLTKLDSKFERLTNEIIELYKTRK